MPPAPGEGPSRAGNLLRTLQVYGDDVTDIVTAEALTPPKRRLKRPPVALDWFPFEALPQVRLADGTPLDPDIVRHWVLEAYRLKTPDGPAPSSST